MFTTVDTVGHIYLVYRVGLEKIALMEPEVFISGTRILGVSGG